jgi:hypothetical protein
MSASSVAESAFFEVYDGWDLAIQLGLPVDGEAHDISGVTPQVNGGMHTCAAVMPSKTIIGIDVVWP